MPKNIEDIIEAGGGRLLLEPLQQLKTRNAFLVDRDDFAVQTGRPLF
jgi:hypothetical protein